KTPFFGVRLHLGPCQPREPPQIEGSRGHQELPRDFRQTPQFGFPYAASLLHPPECLLNQRPLALAHGIALVSAGSSVDGTATGTGGVLRDVRSDAHLPHRLHEVPRVIRLIRAHAHRSAPPALPPVPPFPVQ